MTHLDRLDASDLAIVLPVRVEHADRQNNLDTVLRFFARYFRAYELILVESGETAQLAQLSESPLVLHRFLPGTGPLYKTRMLNIGARLTRRPFVVFYDTDVLFRPEAIAAVLSGLRSNPSLAFGIPYNGIQLDIDGPDKTALSNEFDFDRFPFLSQARLHANYGCDAVCWNPEGVGGATFFRRDIFLDGGGYNEKLVGCYWEDYEIVARFSLIGFPPFWIKDANLYHLHHARTNAGTQDPLWDVNEAEFNRVLKMSPEQVRHYIQTELRPCQGLSGPLPQ